MKFKLRPLERNWVLYDVGNSAFTLLVSTIMPIYFNSLAGGSGLSEVSYLAYWGYATSIATLVVALCGPVLGTISDFPGWKKKLFSLSVLVGALGCVGLGIMSSWLWFLVLFVLAKSAYSVSLVIYDSMLTDITEPERMDKVSANGYAWGYIGSCIPFVLSLVLVLCYEPLGMPVNVAMALAFLLIAAWWLLLSVPLWRSYEQRHAVPARGSRLGESFRRLGRVFSELAHNRKALFFLIAFFFYIDGVYTIIDMATAYGTALGLDTTGLLLALLVTQIVAFPAALLFGRLTERFSSASLILVCIGAYFLITLYGMWMKEQYQFWVLAVCVGIFQGAIQSMSRAYFARLIPPEKSGEYFGLYDICGKGASFLGTITVSAVSQLTGSVNLGVGALAFMFAVGAIFFVQTVRQEAPDGRKEAVPVH
ncbi:MFS transporter [uncultured Pseudoflavonifractor sp.]|uniref:MFS transporter n=1 Tax=uncultured Pseudoflavonifractor sp. TaxID=1221379 RepID=UPI0025EEBF26|nr:MFS transporter [uncultured Pseudoflavonifractor sp.]